MNKKTAGVKEGRFEKASKKLIFINVKDLLSIWSIRLQIFEKVKRVIANLLW